MRLIRRRDLITRPVDGEVVILDRAAGNVHQLNATASYIWGKCDEAQSAAEIAADVAARFEDVPDTVLADVLAAFLQFQQLGLLVEEGEEGQDGHSGVDDRKGLQHE